MNTELRKMEEFKEMKEMDEDLMEPTLRKYLGKIIVCRDRFNHAWAAKLISVKERICFFEISDGRIISNKVDDIVSLRLANNYSDSRV